MVRFFPVDFRFHSRKGYVVILAFAWLCGFLSGALTALFSDPSFISLMRVAPSADVSIVGLVICSLLPLFFSAVAFSFSGRFFLIIFVLFRALLLGYVSTGIAIAYGSSGWLINLLFLFPDLFCMPVLFFFWICRIRSGSNCIRHLPAVLVYALVISYLDYRYVSPFLVNLLTM